MKTRTAETIAQPVTKKGCCGKLRTCYQNAGRVRELSLAGMTAMATFGPKRFRPYFQQILAVISVTAATVQFFRNRKK